MAKDTSIQSATNERPAKSFWNYAALLRQIRQRVLLAQQRAIYAANEEMDFQIKSAQKVKHFFC